MSKQEFVTYTVTGRGHFPFDMLRYDMAFPAKSEDAVRLGSNTIRENRETRSVTLRSTKQPTVGRWESFGWNVKQER